MRRTVWTTALAIPMVTLWIVAPKTLGENERPAASRSPQVTSRARDTEPKIDLADMRREQPFPRTAPAPAQAVSEADHARVAGNADDPLPASLEVEAKAVSFQALLTDDEGDPLAGTSVDLSFRVYNGSTVIEGPINVDNVPMNGGVVSTQVPVSSSSFDGGARALGVSVNGGAEITPRVPLTAVPYAFRVDRVASEELDDQIALGAGTPGEAISGSLAMYGAIAGNTAPGGLTIELDGNNSRLRTYGDNGMLTASLGRYDYGLIRLYDESGGEETVVLSAANDSGGQLLLRDTDETDRIFADGGSGTVNTVESLNVVDTIGGNLLGSLQNGGGWGGQVMLYDTLGGDAALISGNPLLGGGFADFYQNDGTVGVSIVGDNASGSAFSMYDSGGATTVSLLSESSSGGGSVMSLDNSNSSTTLVFDADDADSAHISMSNGDGQKTVEVFADGVGGETGKFVLSDGDSKTVELFGHTNFGSCLEMYDRNERNTVSVFSSYSGGDDGAGRITLRDPDGATSIDLNAETGITRTPILDITGGSDLSERFDISSETDIEPGTVVSIDSDNPGRLRVAARAYDRTVAGIISGAGGIATGMTMGQKGTVADGGHPVALSGRVYVRADATHGAIQPGDLLTSSATTGHAMRVTDHAKAQGAIIGKAMTGLADGRGLVLVLISLQ